MDKKYKAIQTLKDLDLSRGTRSSIGSSSGKSTFSTQSKEDRYNEAFKNDFKSSPKKEAGMDIKPQKLPPLKPQKLPPLQLETKKPLLLKPQKLSPLEGKVIEGKIMNPLTGREVSFSYYKSLVKSGKISDTLSQAKSGKIDFFSPPPETLPEPPSISFPKPIGELKDKIYRDGDTAYFEFAISDPADIDPDYLLMINKNTPTDPKYKKKQLKLQREEFDEEAYVANEVIGDPYGKYADPKRLLKAKPLIDERLRRWVGRKDPNMPAKYSGVGMTTDDYNQDYFDYSSSSSDKMKKYTDLIKTLSPKSDLTAKRPTPRPKNPDLLQVAKKKSSSPKPTTPPKKKRGRPKGALNKPKLKKKSSSSSSGGYNQSSPQYV